MSELVRTVVPPSGDLTASVRMLSTVLGQPDFVDGERWVQFSCGTARVCVGAGTERPAAPAVLVRVDDLPLAIDQVTGAGAQPGPIEQGPHGARCTVRGPGGEALVLYAKRR